MWNKPVLAQASRRSTAGCPGTAGPEFDEPFGLFAKYSTMSCVPMPKDEERRTWLGLRGLWSDCTYNLKSRAELSALGRLRSCHASCELVIGARFQGHRPSLQVQKLARRVTQHGLYIVPRLRWEAAIVDEIGGYSIRTLAGSLHESRR